MLQLLKHKKQSKRKQMNLKLSKVLNQIPLENKINCTFTKNIKCGPHLLDIVEDTSIYP